MKGAGCIVKLKAVPLNTAAYRSFTIDEAVGWVKRLCESKGCSQAVADSLARATVAAQARSNEAVGFRHLADYYKSTLICSAFGRWYSPHVRPGVQRRGIREYCPCRIDGISVPVDLLNELSSL